MRTNTKFLFVFIVLVINTSCRTRSDQLELGDFSNIPQLFAPILIIPPIVNRADSTEFIDDIGANLHLEVAKIASDRVVYADAIPAVKKWLTEGNLIENGELRLKEIVAMGQAVGCATIIAGEILHIESYPPQRMVLKLVSIDSASHHQIAETIINIDLTDKRTQKLFRYYIKGSSPHSFWNLKDGLGNDVIHQSYLSKKDFRRFATAYSLRQLLVAMAESNQMLKDEY